MALVMSLAPVRMIGWLLFSLSRHHPQPEPASFSRQVTLPSHKERTILSIRLQELLDRKSSTAPGGDNGRSATQAGDGDEDDGAEECYLPPRTSAEARCSIIQSKPVCGEIRALVDYLEVIYCRMG